MQSQHFKGKKIKNYTEIDKLNEKTAGIFTVVLSTSLLVLREK